MDWLEIIIFPINLTFAFWMVVVKLKDLAGEIDWE
jgi:hypothetical protein